MLDELGWGTKSGQMLDLRMSSICPSYVHVQGDQVIHLKQLSPIFVQVWSCHFVIDFDKKLEKLGDKNWIEVSTKDKTWIFWGQKLGIVAKN